MLLERVCRRKFLRRAIPDDSINTRRAFALVFGHSSHRERFGAERVGQQVLQGFDFALPAGLCGLHNTRLEPTHGARDLGPVDPVPVGRRVGGRTSRWSSRHLPCLLSRLAKLSCGERPEGSQPAFTEGDVARGSTLICVITTQPSLAPSSCTPCPIGVPYGAPTPREAMGLTLFHCLA